MKLRKVDWLFIVGALGVVVGVSLLPTPKDRNPMIPRTPEHETVRMEKDCVTCHAAGAVSALPICGRSGSGDGRKTSLVKGQWSTVYVANQESTANGQEGEPRH